jgi:uncharacterized protein (TIGR03083 family)
VTDLRATIRAERLAMIELLESLSPSEWATPSLCGEWTVREVAAHVASAPSMGPGPAAVGLARAGFRPNKFNADSAARWARRGQEAILAQLRENAETDAKPIGMPVTAALLDAVVHQLDVRRPLGRPRPVPPDAFAPAADFMAATRWPASVMVGGSVRRRIAGFRLVVDHAGWSWGTGPAVHGSAVAMMLMLTGRPVGEDELTGPGAVTLRARL